MINNKIYFNKFFGDIPFFKSLDNMDDNNSRKLKIYLKHPSKIVFQKEIDKWLKIAYEQKIEEDFKKRLGGNVTFKSLNACLNELMVAYFMQEKLGISIKRYSPPVKDEKSVDWLFEKDKQEFYVEVKTPWEEQREGTFFYSQYQKLFKTVKDAYKQRPDSDTPYIICITDALILPPAMYSDEIIDVLYGKRALVFPEFNGRILGKPRYDIIDKRSIFQQEIRKNLSGVAILRYIPYLDPVKLLDVGRYHFVVFHNPYCKEKCRINPEIFKPFRQYLPNFAKKNDVDRR